VAEVVAEADRGSACCQKVGIIKTQTKDFSMGQTDRSSRKNRFASVWRFFRPVKMTQLQLSVLLLCVVMLALGGGSSFVFTRILEKFVYERTVEPLAYQTRKAVQDHLSQGTLSQWESAESRSDFEQFTSALMDASGVLRINLYNSHQVLIWSTDATEIGFITDNPAIDTALDGSAPYGDVYTIEDGEFLGQPQGNVGELILPVTVEGFPMAVQMYVDVSGVRGLLGVMRLYVSLISLVAVAIMTGFLFIVFRKLGDQIIKQTQELSAMFEKSPVGIVLVDELGRVESVNPSMRGWVDDQGKPFFEPGTQISSNVHQELDAIFRQSSSGEPSEGVLSLRRGTESTWQYVRVVPLSEVGGASGRSMMLFEDITKQKELELVLSTRASNLEKGLHEHVEQLQNRTHELEELNLESQKNKKALLNVLQDSRVLERRLQREHDQLQAIISSMGEGVYVLDAENRIVIMNEAAERTFGVKLKEVKGLSAYDIYEVYRGDELLKPGQRPVRQSLDKGQVIRIRLEDNIFLRLKNGRRFPVTGVISPLGSELPGAVVVFREVTEEKQVDESKTNFISIASHQLRTPLTAIRWLSELLIKESKGILPPQQESYVEDIHQSAGRMVTLVNALLNVSRIESGRVKIAPQKVQLTSIVQEVIKELDMATRASRCEITVKKPRKPLPKISADRDLLRQVIQNLLTNAIRYSRPNVCQIAVKLGMNKTDLLLEVSDNGIGIPEEAKHKIFEKFYRAANAAKSQTEGTGLGLYITKMVVEMAGGTIHFDSTEGIGTTFYVTIPLKGMKERSGDVGLIHTEK
jgi:PAS domain S-box-containing protein